MRVLASPTETFRRRAIKWLLCLFAWLSPVAQAEQLPIKTYTIADGLARDTITRIIQDPDGFLWFCTIEGLTRFDGYKFTSYRTDQGLPHAVVNDLLKTRGGLYWIATGGGVCLFNPVVSRSTLPASGNNGQGRETGAEAKAQEPRFVVYRLGESEKTQYVNVLMEDRAGVIWGGTRGGLYRLEQRDGQWVSAAVDIGMPTESREDNLVLALKEDRQGALWVGAGSGLYRRWPDGRVERYTTGHGLPSNSILSLHEDREGRLWAGTAGGLCRIVSQPQPDQKLVERIYTTQDGLKENNAAAILEAADGTLWVGTNGGISELVRTQGQALPEVQRSYTTANGLSDITIKALAEDRDGNLWVGTDSGGVMKIARHGFITYREADGLGGVDIKSIFQNQEGHLYFTSGSLFVHRFDVDHLVKIGPSFPSGVKDFGFGWYQTVLQDHKGEWWIPTGEGLYRFARTKSLEELAHARPVAVYKMKDGLPGDGIFRLFEDSHGDIWISTLSSVAGQSGLTRWERETSSFHRFTEAEGIGQRIPTAFREDGAGNLWVGFYRGGLARYREGRFTNFTTTDGVPGGLIREIYLDRTGRLWIGTGQTSQSGLCRIDDPTAERPQFVSYTTAQGLSSNDINCVTEDQLGRLYIGTGQGVDRLDPVSGVVRHYTAADGLGSNVVQVALRDREGTLWFGTHRGLSRLVPALDPPRTPSPVMINGLRIAGVQYAVSELGQAEVGGIELGASQNQIQIDFLGIDFTPSEVLHYQYKLEGADTAWSAATDQRTVNYANLSPGSYRFLVRAVDASGLSSQKPAQVSFTILQPIYRRWWFLTICFVLVGFTVFQFERYRAARVKELNAALDESKKLAENLREQGAELHEANRTLELQYEITNILAESLSLREAAPRILQAICQSVGWEMGTLWHVDHQANQLHCVDVWHVEALNANEFERMSREHTFAPGEGLPGRVWQRGEPLWVKDMARESNFPRLTVAAVEGIRSAFGFPILLGGEVYGIIEFFSSEPHQPDEELLETMSTIGIQIGQLIERRRAEEALRRAREERLIELERIRKRIATDLHDDIGSSLTQISILSEVARQRVGHNDSPLTKPLSMIAAASRELVDSMSDIVWAINPQKDHLSDLQQRMRRFASDVFTARNIDFRFRAPDAETDIQLGANIRREVFLIFKESINNMVKHSGCTRADIEFSLGQNHLYLRLTDNGQGFDAARDNDGHGLMSMSDRAKGLGAELEIISHPESGTTIILQVPLTQG